MLFITSWKWDQFFFIVLFLIQNRTRHPRLLATRVFSHPHVKNRYEKIKYCGRNARWRTHVINKGVKREGERRGGGGSRTWPYFREDFILEILFSKIARMDGTVLEK